MPKHHSTPAGYTAERIVGWIFFLFLVGGMIALLVLESGNKTKITDIETHLDHADPVRNTTCDPPAPLNQCVKGYSFTDGNGVKTCITYDSGVGEACTNTECLIENATGTTSTCDANHVCVSSNATECKGYCTLDNLNADWPIVEYASAQCDNKINGYGFYTKGAPLLSSCSVLQWAWSYTDITGTMFGDCQAIGGCTFHAIKMGVSISDDSAFNFNEPGSLSCRDLLNMTVAEQACLIITELPMSGEQSTQYFDKLLADWDDTQLVPGANYSGSLCVYQYACAPNNISAYSDQHYLLNGKRRALLPQKGEEEEEWVAGRRKEDHMEHALPLGAKIGALYMDRLKPGFAALRKGQEQRDAEDAVALAHGTAVKRAALSACS